MTSSATVLDDLAGTIDIPNEGTISRVLYKDDRIRVVVFGFDTDQELTDHTATRPAIVQVVTGRVRLVLDGSATELHPGGWVHMDANLRHAVVALEPTVMLLTLVGAA